MDHPTFCRVEYWSPIAADWWVGHSGLNLMDPQKYIDGVNKKRLARAVVVDTGEIIYADNGADLL
jgi:hypothetical protein